MRLQPVSGPDPLDGSQRQIHRLGHCTARPARDGTGRACKVRLTTAWTWPAARAECEADASCRAADLEGPLRRSAAASATP